LKIADRVLAWFNYKKRSGTYNPAQWLVDWVSGGATSAAGVNVNEKVALKYTPFWAAVRLISGTIAALPFIVYRRTPEGKTREQDHTVYQLLHDRPNEYMDALTFVESRQAQVLTYGNSYAEIQRDGGGRPIALWPLLPDKTFRKIENGIPFYEVRPSPGQTIRLPDYNVLHIKGLGFDGYTGYDVVSYHKDAIGYGIAVKEYGARFFSNDASPGGILEHPNKLSPTAIKNLKSQWNADLGGLPNAHRMKILEEALEVQKYTVDDCARIFNIPPHKIASLDRATFSNIEEQNIDFVTQTMFYWFRKWEQECNYKLFMPSERGRMFCEILVDGLLRGDIKSRYEAYNIGRNAGFLSVNDIREKENMNSIGSEGDIYLEPLNMKPAGKETPEPEPNAERAHCDLLRGLWLRIIPKQAGRDNNYIKLRQHAKKILAEATIAYASILNIPDENALSVLDSVVAENIRTDNKLQHEDAARLSNELMAKIRCLNGKRRIYATT
jgi:HK97 family phage portal protein